MKYARIRISSSDGPAVFAGAGRFAGFFFGAAGLFSRAGWAFFPPADAGGADLLSIFVSAGDEPAAAGPSFSFWTMLFFFATGLIG